MKKIDKKLKKHIPLTNSPEVIQVIENTNISLTEDDIKFIKEKIPADSFVTDLSNKIEELKQLWFNIVMRDVKFRPVQIDDSNLFTLVKLSDWEDSLSDIVLQLNWTINSVKGLESIKIVVNDELNNICEILWLTDTTKKSINKYLFTQDLNCWCFEVLGKIA